MKALFANVWTKRFFSVIASFYTVCVCFLGYYAIYYRIHIDDKTSLCLIVSAVSLIALVLMLYTRKQLLTRISSFLILTAMFPAVLLYFDQKELLIPIIATGVIILLLSGAGEGTKTLVGTMILLLYIFGALGYFVFTSFFVTVSKDTVVESGVSPSGRYRYSIVNTEDSSKGCTSVIIEPNYADVEYPFVKFTLKNMEHTVYQERPMCENVKLDWKMETRQEVTNDITGISRDVTVTLSDEELNMLGYRMDSLIELIDIDIHERFAIGKTAQDVEPIRLDTLSETQLKRFDIGKDKDGRYYILTPPAELIEDVQANDGEHIYLTDLNTKQMNMFCGAHTDELGYFLFDIQKSHSVPLSSLDDAKLAQLGVSDSGDILTFNGKVCFRYYVAEIEDYFDVDSRKLSLDLLNS